MSKETIPQSIIDKINEQYPDATGWNDDHSLPEHFRHAAEFGYGLSEGRIKELEAKLFEINHVCGTVNYSSHNQMKQAIEAAVELSDNT